MGFRDCKRQVNPAAGSRVVPGGHVVGDQLSEQSGWASPLEAVNSVVDSSEPEKLCQLYFELPYHHPINNVNCSF